MEPEPKDGIFKFAIKTLLSVVAVVAGFIQFGHTYSQSVRQPFLEAQMTQCHSAAEHAARIASTLDLDTWKKSREEFWMLYWGPLAIVENVGGQPAINKNDGDKAKFKLVESAMVTFGKELSALDAKSPTLPAKELQQKALAISHACRDLLTSQWNSGLLSLVGF